MWYLSTLGTFLDACCDLLPENINNLLGNTADLVCSERAGTWRYEANVDRILSSSSCLRWWISSAQFSANDKQDLEIG